MATLLSAVDPQGGFILWWGMVLQALTWDSEFFGRRMAALQAEAAPPSEAALRQVLATAPYDFIQCCADIAPPASALIPTLESVGFHFVDLRIELRAPLATLAMSPPTDGLVIRAATMEDLPSLQFARGIFTADSRFHGGDLFLPSQIDDFYDCWIRNSIAGTHDDACYVALKQGEIVGLVTTKRVGGDVLRMGLMGIAPQAQSTGIGSALTQFCTQLARAQGCSTLEAVTEGRNRRTQNFHLRNGLRIHALKSWYYFEKLSA